MAGRPKRSDKRRLASNRQLWRLNTLGRLTLTEDAEPIGSLEASVLIASAAAELEFKPRGRKRGIGALVGRWAAPYQATRHVRTACRYALRTFRRACPDSQSSIRGPMPNRPHGGIGWRVYLTAGDEGAEDVEEVGLYCPACAEGSSTSREFGCLRCRRLDQCLGATCSPNCCKPTQSSQSRYRERRAGSRFRPRSRRRASIRRSLMHPLIAEGGYGVRRPVASPRPAGRDGGDAGTARWCQGTTRRSAPPLRASTNLRRRETIQRPVRLKR